MFFTRRDRTRLLCGFLAVAMAGAWNVQGQPPAPVQQEFPPGLLQRLEDLPPGRFRNDIEGLPQAAQDRALGWLRRIHFTTQDLISLHADPQGGIYYADHFVLGTALLPDEQAPVTAEAAVPVSPFPASLVFHSRPGSANVLFLNFSGEDVSGTAWNSSLGRSTIPTVAFSTDSDYTTFSDAEQTAIKRIWQRVAEDYAPFDIDVTTERPATFTTTTAHLLVTRSTDANSDPNPSSSAGGVAYVDAFGAFNYATYRPAWVYFNNLSYEESYIGEAASHEVGHNLGLTHDGRTDGVEYYSGHGSGETSWGPLMGTGYDRNVSQWSKGDYYRANNTQDDLAILAGQISYRSDDHGDASGGATPLSITDGDQIVATTPETDPGNGSPENKGILERNTDVDVFSFLTGSGPIDLTVTPWIMPTGSRTRGGNMDLLVELRSETGGLLASDNPPTGVSANIQANLLEGLYFLHVRNSAAGDPFSASPSGYTTYGTIGQYFINGSLTASTLVYPPVAELQADEINAAGVSAWPLSVTYTDNLAINVATISDDDIRVTGPNGYDRAGLLASIDLPGNGTPRVAVYEIGPPDGSSWTSADNGIYTVWMQADEVADAEGGWVAAQLLGQFDVRVPASIYVETFDSHPGWGLEPRWEYGSPSYSGGGPTAGFTGSDIIGYDLDDDYENRLSAKYATTLPIDCSDASDLRLRFQRWLRLRNRDTARVQVSTDGTDWSDVWSTSSSVTDDGWQEVEYPLPSWVDGSSSLQLRWGISSSVSQSDIGWNIDDVEIIGVGQLTPPQVSLAVTANNDAWGSVTPTGGVYTAGSIVELLAIPAEYCGFVEWAGAMTSNENPLGLVLYTNTAVQAVFGEVLTTNYPTPHWWLASYGYTNDFESAVAEVGANSMPLWQSYVAGLNPSDPASQLRLSLTRLPTAESVFNWNTVSGRVYTVLSSTNVLAPFAPVDGATDLPWTTQSITNSADPSSPAKYYLLEVRKP